MGGPLRIEVAGETNVGMKRTHNEDNFSIIEESGLYIVADGMGGHASGEIASKMAVDVHARVLRGDRERPRADVALQDGPLEGLRRKPAHHGDQAREPAHLRERPARCASARNGHYHRRALRGGRRRVLRPRGGLARVPVS